MFTTTKTNAVTDHDLISNAQTNGNPNSVIFVTQNWNPEGIGRTYNNTSGGASFDGTTSLGSVFEESQAAMTKHAAFNLVIFSS